MISEEVALDLRSNAVGDVAAHGAFASLVWVRHEHLQLGGAQLLAELRGKRSRSINIKGARLSSRCTRNIVKKTNF